MTGSRRRPPVPDSCTPLFELSDLAPEKHPGACAEPPRHRGGVDQKRVDIIRTGTTAGYAAHKAAGESPCIACVTANSTRSASRRGADLEEYRAFRHSLDQYKKRVALGERVPACAKPSRKHPDGRTGTALGWHAHYYAKEDPCEACREGNKANFHAVRAASPEKTLDQNLRLRFNLPLEEYRAKLQAQDGKCAICGVASPTDRRTSRFHVDHDHRCCPTSRRTCGKCTRGLLCHACNTALGNFKDDPDILMSAVAYLLSYTSVLEAIDAG